MTLRPKKPKKKRFARRGDTKGRRRRRRAKDWERVYFSLERVLAVKAMKCAVPGCQNPAENAHTENGGTGRKADACTIANLCRDHHLDRKDSLHNLGSCEAFKKVHGIDPRDAAAEVERLLPTRGLIPGGPDERDMPY